ncbi:MAG: hypothetical protein ACOYL9_07330 [Ilumatobacteraceae bacterium]
MGHSRAELPGIQQLTVAVGRVLAVAALATGGLACLALLLDLVAASADGRSIASVVALSLLVLAQVVALVRLTLLTAVAGAGSADPATSSDPTVGSLLVEARTGIAVICTGEPIPAVRVAVSAAVAAASTGRVLLVGDHPALDDLARSYGIVCVTSDGTWEGGVLSAVRASRTDLLALVPASFAVLAGMLRRTGDVWDEGCVFVQTNPASTLDPGVIERLRTRMAPVLDRRDATMWEGAGSIVDVDVFAELPIGRGPAAVSVALHAAGHHGRFTPVPLLARQTSSSARGPQPAASRSWLGGLAALRHSTVRSAQRVAHVQRATDSLGPLGLIALGCAVVATSVALAWPAASSFSLPMSTGTALVLLVAAGLATAARAALTGGVLLPMSLAFDAATQLRRADRSGRVLGAMTVALEACLVMLAIAAITRADSATAAIVVVAVGAAVLLPILVGAGLLVRRHTPVLLDAHRPAVSAKVGTRRLPVVRLDADAVQIASDQPVALLGTMSMLLSTDTGTSVMTRGQVVRVESARSGDRGPFVVTVRLLGSDAAGQYDEYVALWAASARRSVEVGGPTMTTRVRSGGNRVLRVASAAALLCLAVAMVPLVATARADAPDRSNLTATSDPTPTTTLMPTGPTTTVTTATTIAPATTAAPTTTVAPSASANTATTLAPVAAGDDTPTLTLTLRTSDATGTASILQPTVWEIEVANVVTATGGVSAHGVDLAVTLPPNWSYQSTVSIAPQRCDVAPVVAPVDNVQTITWTDLCTLEPGEVLTLAVGSVPELASALTPGVARADGGRAAHRSSVRLSAEDAAGNALGSATAAAATVLRSVDLSITLTDGGPDDHDGDDGADGARFVVMSDGQYRMEVRNAGPDVALGPITATLDIPNGLMPTAATGTNWTCALAARVTCTTPGPLGVGQVLPAITVPVRPLDPTTGTVTATATVTSSSLDMRSDNDTDTEVTPIRAESDTAISSALSIATLAAPGARIDMIITVVANGPSPLNGDVVVTDPVPVGMRFLSASGPGWMCGASRGGRAYTADPDDNGKLECRRNARNVAAGALPVIVARFQIDPLATADAVAAVGTTPIGAVQAPSDTRAQNDRSDATAVTNAAGDGLRLFVSDSDATAPAGGTISYDVIVGNRSTIPDPGPIVVTGAGPKQVRVDALGGEGWRCDAPAPRWTCTWTGSAILEPGQTLSPITTSGTVDAEATGVLRHDISVSGAGGAGATASVATPIGPKAQLAVQATTTPQPWPIGGEGTTNIVVRNDGPSGERGPVAVTAVVPEGTDVATARGSGWDCTIGTRIPGAGTTVRCLAAGNGSVPVAGLVPAGDSLPPIAITVALGADATAVRQEITVVGSTDSTPHAATAFASVGSTVDLSIVADRRWTPVRGATSTLTWTVANAGPTTADAGAVTIAVTLPDGATSAGTGDGWTCAGSTQPMTCTLDGALVAGSSASFTLDVAVAPDAPVGVETPLRATVSSDGSDPTPDDATLTLTSYVGGPSSESASAGPVPTEAATAPATATAAASNEGLPAGAADVLLRCLGGLVVLDLLAMALVLLFGARRPRLAL